MLIVTFDVVDSQSGQIDRHEGFEMVSTPRIGEGVIWDGEYKTVISVTHDLDSDFHHAIVCIT